MAVTKTKNLRQMTCFVFIEGCSDRSNKGPSNWRRASVVFTLLMFSGAEAVAQEVTIFSISDELKSQNDCRDQSNQECKALFENTCSWVGDISIIFRDGIANSIPMDRVWQRVTDDLIEMSEGSAGYVDVELAESFTITFENYFQFGQYEMEFRQFNAEAHMHTVWGSYGQDTARIFNERRDNLLRQKWHDACIQAAYFY